MIDIFIIIIALIVLIYGSYSDIKTREIPDWANYGLIALAIAVRLIFSVVELNPIYILEGIFGLGVMFLFALLMFYTGQWGGGDSKLIMGFGALIGVSWTGVNQPILIFLVNSLLFGALFSFIWSVVLAIKKWKLFKKQYDKIRMRFVKLRLFFLIFLVVAVVSTFVIEVLMIKLLIFSLFSVAVITFYMWIFVKAVESSCMTKAVPIEKLTEGDWIVKPVFVGNKYITGPKELGISEEQIKSLKTLKKKKKLGKNFKITIKEGVPFVPSFLAGYVGLLIWGNWLHLMF